MTSDRGDTIIEVILATSILAMVTVSSFAIMQRASASAYDALERSVVRLQLNTQAELLSYYRDAYSNALNTPGGVIPGSPAEKWSQILALGDVSPPDLNTCMPPDLDKAFYLTHSGIGADAYTTATGLPSAGKGLWVVRDDPNGASPNRRFQDFYLISCWPTTTGGEQRMSSVVRLYDPTP